MLKIVVQEHLNFFMKMHDLSQNMNRYGDIVFQ
jgi:hypothetical protein